MANFLCSLIWPIIESYWASLVYLFTLETNKSHVITYNNLQFHIQYSAEILYDERIIEHNESLSLDTLKNAVSTFKNMKLIIV